METSGPVAKPPASAPLRSPSLLEVTVELDSVARRSAYPLLGYVPVTVRARNPNDFGFAVRSPGYSGHFVTFEMRLTPPQTIPTVQTVFLVETDDPMSAYFAPGETKTHVFDVYLPITGAGYGNWAAASGFYGSSMITPTTFRYTP